MLRPIGLDDTERGRIAEWVVSRIGGEYDLRHAWALARSLLPAAPKPSFPQATNGLAESANRFICSTLLANAFARVGRSIPALRTAAAAAGSTGPRYVIPSDFAAAPVFEVVRP